MDLSNLIRQHWAALRALLALTVITGFLYPLIIWGIAFLPGLHAKAEGSIINASGRAVGSKLIGQLFTDKDGNPLPRYFQSRPSAAGAGYDPTSSGATNLGPESIVDTPADPAKLSPGADPSTAGFKPSLLTQVCSRSIAIGRLEKVDGSRPFCTGSGVGAVLSVIGPRDRSGRVPHPTQVVSINEPCTQPGSVSTAVFQQFYEGVRVQCAQYGQDYSIGQLVPIRGSALDQPDVPADAVTASASGLDPDISPAYADLQVARVARARGISVGQVRDAVRHNQHGRLLGFVGEPVVNVLAVNLELDRESPGEVLNSPVDDVHVTSTDETAAGADDPLAHRMQRRGELRIYLGAAPGVGKTCAMLGEAHRRLERGTDVVAAVVETHGRKKVSELIKGIEVIPPHYISYRGTMFPELDIEAVLRRNPEVALVDEYAHSNIPGSINDKRWQDIETLLDAGITVISTLNIQHLESLNDVVAQITGIEQRETVPDEIVRKAAQIELVDITPEALRRRLAHGNVYPSERIDAALTNYFRTGNLTALREIALLWLADQVDAALAKYRADKKITDTWEARERVVVAVTGGPESETLVRRASRIASKSSAQLMVVNVARGDGLSGASPREMGKVRELAARLGATVHVVVGDDVPTALLDFARETNSTQLVLGSSRRSRWASIFSEGIGAATIKDSGKIDVHMVTHEQANRGLTFSSISPRARQVVSWLAALSLPWAILAITSRWLDPTLDVGGKTAIFFAGVIAVALFGGVAPAVLSGLLSGALLVYFHTEPRNSFAVASPSNALTIVILLGVAMGIAVLVDAAASRAREARRASQEAELLSLFAASVLRGADLNTLLERVREAYSQRAVCLVRDVDGHPEAVAGVGVNPCMTVDSADTAVKVGDEEFWLLMSGRGLTGRDRRVLSVVATQAAGLVKRGELAEEASKVQSLAEADELRRLLLSALGHDLRTPLTAAKAAVSSLRAEDVWFSPEDTSELLATVEESLDQLTLLVANLLDSSRLAAGVVKPVLTEVYLEEVVQRALVGIGGRSTMFGRGNLDRVKVEVGGTIAMGDAGLLERVLSNLIDNALRYAPGSVVRINAGQVGTRVLINVVDEGPGVSKGAAEQMFQPFQRLGDFDTTTGLGLGLSVAKGFVEAMDGTVTASDTPGGGLTIVVDLAAPQHERGKDEEHHP